MNKKLFYDKVRASFGPLTQKQVDGFEIILNEGVKRGVLKEHLAYILATVWHETAHTMQPVKEYGGEKYLRSKKYYPYYGRGYVQLTWKDNYVKYGIADNPDKALDALVAVEILYDGMLKGVFTGKKLSDYFNDKVTDWRNARRIVNGLDKADLIGGYGKLFAEAIDLTPTAVEKPKKGFWATFFEYLFGV
jgi:hypothetical protein